MVLSPAVRFGLCALLIALAAGGCGGNDIRGFDKSLSPVPRVQHASPAFGRAIEQTCIRATRELTRENNSLSAPRGDPFAGQLRSLKHLRSPFGERDAYSRLILVVEHFERGIAAVGRRGATLTDLEAALEAEKTYASIFATLVRELDAPTCLAEVGRSQRMLAAASTDARTDKPATAARCGRPQPAPISSHAIIRAFRAQGKRLTVDLDPICNAGRANALNAGIPALAGPVRYVLGPLTESIPLKVMVYLTAAVAKRNARVFVWVRKFHPVLLTTGQRTASLVRVGNVLIEYARTIGSRWRAAVAASVSVLRH